LSTDLVNIETQNAIVKQQSDSWGEETDEIKPVYIALKQPTSETLDAFKNGSFVYKTLGKSWDSMNIIPLQILKTRKKQTPYQPGVKSETLCRSNNRIVPVTNDDRFTPLATTCASCKYGDAAWAGYDKATKTGTKPSCDKEIQVLFIEQESGQPYIYSVRGTGVKPVEAMFEAIKAISKDVQGRNETANRLARGTGVRPQIYEFVITMTSERAGKNYIPKFTKVVQMTPENAASFGPLYEQFVTARQLAFENRAKEASVDAAIESGEVEEQEPVQAAAQVQPEYLPPPTKRRAGTRPVYVPPTEDKQPI